LKRCASGILLKDNRILLGKRTSDRELCPNTWDVIGGHCLPGEELASTLTRELQEEIGATPTVFSKLAVLHEPRHLVYGEREYHIYVITEWSGRGPILLGAEHSEIRWFTIEEAIQLDLAHVEYTHLFAKVQRQAAKRGG